MSASNYPAGFDDLQDPSGSDPLDSLTYPHADQHADANSAIEAIQATLGLNPQGSSGTVGARIAAAENAVVDTMKVFEYTATAGQTTFTGNDLNGLPMAYTVGLVHVYLNGVLLQPGDDYLASSGTSIVLGSGASAGDALAVVAYKAFSVANTYTQTETDSLLAGKAATADFPNTAWTAYTPTLGGTGWAIGDGTIVGVYVKLGKTVHFRVNITFGSTSTYGASSSARVSLPLAAANTGITNASALFVDASAGAVHFGSAHRPVDANTVYVQTVGTLGVLAGTTSGNPFAWTSSDQMRISGTYETSA